MNKIEKIDIEIILDKLLKEASSKDKGKKDNLIYNEVSLQFELGKRIKEKFPNYCVEYERNIKRFGIENKKDKNNIKKYNKSEIDIVIYEKDKEKDINSNRYAIELKYPAHRKCLAKKDKYLTGEYPYRMRQFLDDIIFMDKLKKEGFSKTFCITFVDDKSFHTGKNNSSNEIYQCFREPNLKPINRIIKIPSRKDKNTIIDLRNIKPTSSIIKWQHFNPNDQELAYYIVEF